MISIIMSTYNRADTIKKAIESVLWQTEPDWELIIVDDASTDPTSAVVKSYKDKRIKYIRLPENIYYSWARNVGIEKGKGELIAFHDDDVIWMPKFLEDMQKPFRSPDVILTYCGRISYRGVDLPTLDMDRLDELPPAIVHPIPRWEGKDSLSDKIDVNEIMFRRSVFKDDFQGFPRERDNAGYCSDAKLIDRIMKHNRNGKIVAVPRRHNRYFYDHGAKEANMTIKKIEHRDRGEFDNELESKWSW